MASPVSYCPEVSQDLFLLATSYRLFYVAHLILAFVFVLFCCILIGVNKTT